MKAYIASPLFSQAEQMFNIRLAATLRQHFPNVEFYLPQENEAINDKNAFADSIAIAKADSEKLLESDFLVAVLDGREIDAGVAAEIGMFSMTGKPIFALGTEIRMLGRDNKQKYEAFLKNPFELQWRGYNLFVIGRIYLSGGTAVTNVYDLVSEIDSWMKSKK